MFRPILWDEDMEQHEVEESAARILQHAYRYHRLSRAVARYAVFSVSNDALDAKAAARGTYENEGEEMTKLPLRRVWPFAREAIGIMLLAAILSIAPRPSYTLGSGVLAVPVHDSVWIQLRGAALGAVCIVGGLLMVALLFVALLAHGYDRVLSTAFTCIIGLILGMPSALLILECCRAARVPLDVFIPLAVGWNMAISGIALFMMPVGAAGRPQLLRRVYVAFAAALLAWILSPVPWLTIVISALMIVFLDLLLVLCPSSPVRPLLVRSLLSETLPSLTLRVNGLELLIGDFFAFAVLGFHAADMGMSMLFAAILGVSIGLTATMHRVASTPHAPNLLLAMRHRCISHVLSSWRVCQPSEPRLLRDACACLTLCGQPRGSATCFRQHHCPSPLACFLCFSYIQLCVLSQP